MPTPALGFFLNNVGQTVHHLNTAVVGLSGLEHGNIRKPDDLDISWAPADVVTSARKARLFLVKTSLAFVSGALTEYIDSVATYPAFERPENWSGNSNAEKLLFVNDWSGAEEDYLALGGALLVHWRNRIIHPKSNAALSSRQRDIFVASTEDIRAKYKNLDAMKLLRDFESGTYTLKGASSLVAMSITLARRIDAAFLPPSSQLEFEAWARALGLSEELLAVEQSAGAGRGVRRAESFLRTHCSFLASPYAAIKGTG